MYIWTGPNQSMDMQRQKGKRERGEKLQQLTCDEEQKEVKSCPMATEMSSEILQYI